MKYQVIQHIAKYDSEGRYVVDEIPLRSFLSQDEADNYASQCFGLEHAPNVGYSVQEIN